MPYSDPEKQKLSTKNRQERKRNEFRKWKEDNPCSDCGNFYPYYIMQLDHTSDKKFNIAQRSASYGSKYFFEEIAKCDLVCSNCHAVRTHERSNAKVAQR